AGGGAGGSGGVGGGAVGGGGAGGGRGRARAGARGGIVAGAVATPPADAVSAPGVPFLCIVAEEEPGRAGLVAAVTETGGRVEVVPGADARFQRNLPEVGRLLLRWLQGAGKPLES